MKRSTKLRLKAAAWTGALATLALLTLHFAIVFTQLWYKEENLEAAHGAKQRLALCSDPVQEKQYVMHVHCKEDRKWVDGATAFLPWAYLRQILAQTADEHLAHVHYWFSWIPFLSTVHSFGMLIIMSLATYHPTTLVMMVTGLGQLVNMLIKMCVSENLGAAKEAALHERLEDERAHDAAATSKVNVLPPSQNFSGPMFKLQTADDRGAPVQRSPFAAMAMDMTLPHPPPRV